MKVVLDTHAAVWWSCLPERMGRGAARALAEATEIAIPAIVFWEVSLLVRRRKLELGMPVATWAAQIQSIPRCKAIALTPELALVADGLEMHSDAADRFVVATALSQNSPLITKDRLIRDAKVVATVW